MSNLESAPQELRCPASAGAGGRPRPVEVFAPINVPLGGPRAMSVRRTLPRRQRWRVGAWCFLDHYGPNDVAGTGGMDVAPHPHTGLQTVSWLFSGEVEHRDSLGTHALVRPGELNLMTAGAGICHSEVSTPDTTVLHGVQLWIALPDAHRHAPRAFEHYTPMPAQLPGAVLRVFIGSLAGQTSPAPTFSPLLGAEVRLQPGAQLILDVDPSFEHAFLSDTESVAVDGVETPWAALAFLEAGRSTVTLANHTDEPARGLLLGGEPLDEEIVMWWNFLGRSHEEIAAYRREWERKSDQFGRVQGYRGSPARLPAPPLPNVRLRPRGSSPD
ncbi:pirin family protein [Mycolicibacterium brumae]|uniref:pirin family protein n=1 Tax=Mycolicibacterium brumae TaxID=85968 RepID=UPI000FF9F242|nr:pirin family protein [Mycolicibacterium brumae]RWA23295.1 hypothetical protein MBRU_00315 [Mycolicibacterium brumae DSM 44177]UWW08777.1 pirin family protein [Mycolicibacterium brumae]